MFKLLQFTFLFTLIFSGCSHFQPATVESALEHYSVESPPLPFQISRTSSDQGFTMIEATGEKQNSLTVTLFENKDAKFITEKFDEKTLKAKSIFEGVTDHYFPVINKKILCEPKFLPKFYQTTKPEQTEFTLYAFGNDRNNLGACDSSTVKRKILYFLLKCKNSLAEFQFSTGLNESLDQFKPVISSLKCLF
jgi:hypothetical protein